MNFIARNFLGTTIRYKLTFPENLVQFGLTTSELCHLLQFKSTHAKDKLTEHTHDTQKLCHVHPTTVANAPEGFMTVQLIITSCVSC